MKLKTLIVATASAAMCAGVMAQNLNEKSGGSYTGAMPVGIVTNPIFRDILQANQFGAGSACIGNDSTLCQPSVNTVELSTIMHATFGMEWGSFGITDLGTGGAASIAVCGTLAHEPLRVAARHVGIGCSSANPDSQINNQTTAVFGLSADTTTCLTQIETFPAGALGFVTYDATDPAYRFVKLDGEAADLANFIAGNYAMFGDVHNGSLPGQVDAIDLPPMHASAGNFSLSNECASGRLRQNGNDFNGDLVSQ